MSAINEIALSVEMLDALILAAKTALDAWDYGDGYYTKPFNGDQYDKITEALQMLKEMRLQQ